jgi:hypothetical protein
MLPVILNASAAEPITIYYCKAGIKSGQVCRVQLAGVTFACSGVKFSHAVGCMLNNNSVGRPKRSGARCVLQLSAGHVELIAPVSTLE